MWQYIINIFNEQIGDILSLMGIYVIVYLWLGKCFRDSYLVDEVYRAVEPKPYIKYITYLKQNWKTISISSLVGTMPIIITFILFSLGIIH